MACVQLFYFLGGNNFVVNIVFLYTRLQPSVITLIKELVKQNSNVTVFYWDKNAHMIHDPPEIDNVKFFKKSNYNNRTLYQDVIRLVPHVLYVSGWMDRTYLSICKKLRKNFKTPIVVGSDTQWRGGSQWFNVIVSPLLHKKCFSHIQIAGIWQYEYARRLGFSKNQILMHNLSADVSLFSKINIKIKAYNYPKRFIYIGRLIPIKGLKSLISAWGKIENKNKWKLTLVGDGPEKEELLGQDDIEIVDFLTQEQLCVHLQNAGCFIFPSLWEPWAVVLHEAASAGLPILASNVCGAVPYFLINNYNGIIFQSGDIEQIKRAIEQIVNTTESNLLEMSQNSRKLSQRITPEIVAKTLLSVLKK